MATDRSVTVRLRAEVASFVAEMDKGTKAVDRVKKKTKETEEAASGALGQLVRSASKHGEAWERSGAVIAGAGAGILAVVAGATAAYMKFDEAMATVAADTRLTGGALQELRQAAIDAGAATSFSATEAAEGIDELAKAGVSSADILSGGLAGSLALAAAGALDVGKSAEIASAAMVQFNLDGSDVGHVADLLAAGAGKALGSVEDLGMALNQGGLVASQMGMSIEETTGTLAAFASAGLKGSDAGTSMKTSLLMLANPSEKASNLMAELGINAYDASGNFVGMVNLAGQLQSQLGGLTQAQRDQALATIFGSDAIRAANVLYTQGASGVQGWIDKTNDAGYAAEQAALKLDTLRGDWEYLTGDLEALALTSGGSLYEFFRTVVQGADDVVEAFSDLPDFVQSGALSFGAVAGAGLLAAGAFVTLAPRVLDTVEGFRTLAGSSDKASKSMAAIGKASAALGIAAAAWGVLQVAVDAVYDGTVTSLSETTKALLDVGTSTASVDAIIKATGDGQWFQFDGLADAAKQLSDPSWEQSANTFLTMSNGADKAKEQIGLLGDSLGLLVSQGNADVAKEKFDLLAAEWERGGGTIEELKKLMPGYTDALADAENAQSTAAPSADELASSVTGVGAAGEEAGKAVDGLGDALDALLSQFFSVDQAADDFQSKLNGLAGAAKENGRELSGTTDKAIANREALRGTADAAANLIQKMAEQGSTSEELQAKATSLKEEFLKQAKAAGFTGAEVDKVAAAYDAMPRLVQVSLATPGLAATSSALDSVARKIEQLNGKTITTYFQTKGDASGLGGQLVNSGAGKAVARADGGLIPLGLGGPREDNVLTWTSSGEYVVNAAATKKNLPLLEAINAQKLADGGLVRGASGLQALASGGQVAAGQTATGEFLMSQLSARPGGLSDEGYTAALDASALAAHRAERAETLLDRVRERNSLRLEAYKERLQEVKEAQEQAADAAIEAMQQGLEDLRDRQSDAMQALKDSNAAAKDALQSRTKDQKVIREADRRADAAERALKDAQATEVEAQQKKIAEAKKANEKASKDLAKANKDLIATAEKRAESEEAAAQEKLTAAKEADKKASEELAEAERALAEQRSKALALAEQVASALTRNATLAAAYGDTSVKTMRDSAEALSEASAAADNAARNARGEDAAAALSRRAAALEGLAASARSYAAAQEAMGVDASVIGAGLDQVGAKIRDLGQAYGLTAAQVSKLTGSLDVQRTSGADVLASMQRELAKTTELAASVRKLMDAGLDQSLLDQVIGGGTKEGLALARAILGGGSGLIGDLNTTQAALTATANGLGSSVAAARYGPAVAPAVSGGVYGAASSTVALDAASTALLNRTLAAVSSRPSVFTLDGIALASNLSQRAADAAYGAEAP